MNWKLILLFGMLVSLFGFVVWGLVLTYENDAETVARREALPSMVRAGEVEVNRSTLYLWAFEFEGKQCLWATAHYGHGGRGGLTCWKVLKQ